MPTKRLAILNTVLCLIALACSLVFALMAGLSQSDNGGISQMQKLLAQLGTQAPVVPILGIIGGWMGHSRNQPRLITLSAVLPWVFMLVVGGLFFILPAPI